MVFGQKDNPNDPRVNVLRRFRNFAIFWIGILVIYFLGVAAFVDVSGTSIGSALPVLLLLFGCVLIGSVWHAAAIITMTATNLFDKG